MTQLTATPISATEIKLDWVWANPSLWDGTTVIQISTDNASWSALPPVGGGVLTYNATGLTSATTYYFRIRKDEWTCYSQSESATTL